MGQGCCKADNISKLDECYKPSPTPHTLDGSRSGGKSSSRGGDSGPPAPVAGFAEDATPHGRGSPVIAPQHGGAQPTPEGRASPATARPVEEEGGHLPEKKQRDVTPAHPADPGPSAPQGATEQGNGGASPPSQPQSGQSPALQPAGIVLATVEGENDAPPTGPGCGSAPPAPGGAGEGATSSDCASPPSRGSTPIPPTPPMGPPPTPDPPAGLTVLEGVAMASESSVATPPEGRLAVPPNITPPTLLPPLRSTKFSSCVVDTKDSQGRRTVNDYVVHRHLGSGRYGDVYLVENAAHERYAMKEVSKKVFSTKKSDLSKEVLVLTKIDHPNVVKLIEVMDDEKLTQQFLILEYVDGGAIMTLDDSGTSREDPFPEEMTRSYFQQIVEGLCYLHDLNIIHRDIKPENILVTRDRKTVKLADFGVSRAMNSEDDGSRDTGGTPLFLSPEACRGDFSSGKSNDIWALGVTLYIFMYGKAPFIASNEVVLYRKIQNGDIVYPNKPKYSRELRAFIRRLLERDILLRITLNEVRNHSWNRGSSAPVPDAHRVINGSEDVSATPAEAGPRGVTPLNVVDARTVQGGEHIVNILIVEDVFLVKKLTERMFKSLMDPSATVNIVMVSDGADAIEACQSTRFHLVLMDVHMSRVSGVSATCEILKYERERNLAATNIVGLTADPHADMDKLCIAAGMIRVIQKPLQPSILRDICQKFELPLTDSETKFDASDFKKGEVRGGGHNNAYLKSYQEHLDKGGTDKVAGADEENGGSTDPSQNGEAQLSQSPGAGEQGNPGQGAGVQGGGLTPNPKLGEMMLTREGSVASDLSMSTSSRAESTISGTDSLDMRNRSLHCMKQHKNMYGKKNCDDKFNFIAEDDLRDAHCALLQGVVEDTDWTVLNRLTQEDALELHELWSENSDGWTFELQAIHTVVPREDLLEKFQNSDTWETIHEARAQLPDRAQKLPPSGLRLSVYTHEEIGNRKGMEDTSAVLFHPSALIRGDKVDNNPEVAVGVFDGHGGKYAAEYCKAYLLSKVVRHPLYHTDLGAAMKQGYHDCNKGFFKKVEGVDCDAGTTAMVAVVHGRTLTVANTGDCRLVIGSRKKGGSGLEATQVTNLHVCESKEERLRVEKRGGSVIHYMGSWRVNGVLLVTRSIGDMPCRDFVTCEPDIHTWDLTPEDQFAVLASDGLWDVMTPAEVCDAVQSAREELDAAAEGGDGGDGDDGAAAGADGSGSDEDGEGEEDEEEELSYAAIPEALTAEAVGRGSTDNVTCTIVFFEWPEAGAKE